MSLKILLLNVVEKSKVWCFFGIWCKMCLILLIKFILSMWLVLLNIKVLIFESLILFLIRWLSKCFGVVIIICVFLMVLICGLILVLL